MYERTLATPKSSENSFHKISRLESAWERKILGLSLKGNLETFFGHKIERSNIIRVWVQGLMAEYEVHSNGFWFLIGEDEQNHLAWQRHTYKFGLEILVG